MGLGVGNGIGGVGLEEWEWGMGLGNKIGGMGLEEWDWRSGIGRRVRGGVWLNGRGGGE